MLRRLLWLPGILFINAVAAPLDSAAGVPDPAQSTVDVCLRVCPDGDLGFSVVVRDVNSLPVVGSFVALDPCTCPDLVLCPDEACPLTALTDSLGGASFSLPAGGGCATPIVEVRADGILLAAVRVVSPDQDGNKIVDAADDALLTGKLGGGDLSGDLDCDGAVTAGDLAELQLHLEHNCLGPVQNMSGSWGRMKAIYR